MADVVLTLTCTNLISLGEKVGLENSDNSGYGTGYIIYSFTTEWREAL